MLRNKTYAPSTRALHIDRNLEANHGVAPAITQSVTYYADDSSDFARKAEEPLNDQFYARHGNVTSSRIAKVIADLEGAEAGMMFASGMGAITTAVLSQVAAGDHVVAQANHYIGTTNLLTQVLPRYGVAVTQVEQSDPSAFEKALRPTTKLIMIETPVNPTMHLTDLAAVAAFGRASGAVTLCDNTFATPINQRPIALGIDIVVHSATKYIGGHHDLLAGCICSTKALLDRAWNMSMTIGALSAPMNSWLALRGVRTLALRIAQHNKNAEALARFLHAHPKVDSVHYPWLESHPQHALAKAQMTGGGGLLTFTLNGGYDAGVAFLRNCKLVQNAGSLGGVDSIAIQPAAMWAGRLPAEVIAQQGVRPGMIRFATGIEDTDDLIADVDAALERT
ncbi:cystathionine beta-lyase/cystathionine gamma-synthase [Bradyrhizobium sp. USDA 4518]